MRHKKVILNFMLLSLLLFSVKTFAQDGQCTITTVNYDFEEPEIDQTSGWPSMIDDDQVPGWNTTASDGIIEFWPNSNNGGGIQAYSGDQYIELNANETSGVYQDYQTPIAGIEFNYSFAHAARNFTPTGEDVVGVYAGIPGQTLILVAQYSSEVNTGWQLKTGSYIVPAGQTETRFEFRAISTASGNPTVGNFLDVIQFTANFGILTQDPLIISCTNTISVEALGEGQWVADDANNPSPTTIADPNSGNTTITGLDNLGTYTFAWTSAFCYDLLPVEVVEGNIPVNTIFASLPEVCDMDRDGWANYDLTQSIPLFIDNPEDYQIDYYESQTAANSEDPDELIVSPENYPVQAGSTQTIFIRIGSGTCYRVVALQLKVYVVPEIENIVDLNSCDDSAGFFSIDLTQNNDYIIGGQNPENVAISYYLTLDDAENAQNQIGSPSTFEIADLGCETIYVRVENPLKNECYQIADFQACAVELSIGGPEDLQSCTMSENGLAIFNLTQNDALVLGAEDPTEYDISYYTSMSDAEDGVNPIGQPSDYQSENETQTIYVRLEGTGVSNCYAVENFTIISNQVAITTVGELEVCGDTPIDLIEEQGLLGLSPGQEVTGYYTSMDNAANDINPIPDPSSYALLSQEEAIYIKVEDENAACFAIYILPLVEIECELEIPNGFSPNGDGTNDVFEITGLYENYPKFNIWVFSRYGNIVYEGNTTKSYWQGISDGGGQLPTGTYYYVLNLNEPNKKIIKGWVYLIR